MVGVVSYFDKLFLFYQLTLHWLVLMFMFLSVPPDAEGVGFVWSKPGRLSTPAGPSHCEGV